VVIAGGNPKKTPPHRMNMRVRRAIVPCIVSWHSQLPSTSQPQRKATVPIRVVTVEDDPQYRSSLELLFRHADDFELVDSFGSPEAALSRLDGSLAAASPAAGAPGAASPHVQLAAPVGWDLVLMDVDLPGMNGIACTRRIKQHM